MRYLELAGGSATWQTPARSGGPSPGAPQAPRSRPAPQRDAVLTRSAAFSDAGPRPGCSPYASCPCWCSRPPRCCRVTRPTRCSAATAASSPAALRRLEAALHLNRGLLDQYWLWFSGLVTGHLGHSLVNGRPVWGYVAPRLINSAVLMGVTGLIGAVVGVGARRAGRAPPGRLARPRLRGHHAGGDRPAGVRGRDRPDHPVVHGGHPPAARRYPCCRRAATPGTPRGS